VRFRARACVRRLVAIVMMAAAVAFTVQATFVAMSEAATGDTSHYYQGFALRHALGDGAAHSHVIKHVHADGTVHRHAVDDDALDEHIKQRGWNMAVVVGVLPCLTNCIVATIVGSKLGIEMPSPLQIADQDGLRKPPRPPCIT
jgi:ABC-type nickel/cobalt efflux system permease component RcnA